MVSLAGEVLAALRSELGRAPEEVPLPVPVAQLLERPGLRDGLDALGDHVETEGAAHGHDRAGEVSPWDAS
jgi:hypothetical protein